MRKLTKEQFIIKATKIHRSKYNYSKSVYKGYDSPIIIVCPKHGKFLKTPDAHIGQKQGCPKCQNYNKHTIKQFVDKAHKIHGNQYSYNKVNYKNTMTKVSIVCHIHGKFLQSPNSHLYGHGCPKCNKTGPQPFSTKEFIKKAKKIHNDKYSYTKVNYINIRTKIEIVCPIHGKFLQTPHSHLNGDGCRYVKYQKVNYLFPGC